MTTDAPQQKQQKQPKPDKAGSYKDTLNLPQTPFPMEAKLVQNEPARLAKWQQADLYQQVLRARENADSWVLHDGPPFANGDIHIGHVINKTLKDVFIRFRTMRGYRTPYVPGWDCHGLPIEHKIQQELGAMLREMCTLDVRKKCYAYAVARRFPQVGVVGPWTMAMTYGAILGAYLLWRFRRGRWKQIRLDQPGPDAPIEPAPAIVPSNVVSVSDTVPGLN